MAKITIFGLAGTGTSSVGRKLAEKLNYQFKSSGNIFRDMAKDMGLDIYELDELGKKDSKYDLELDNKIEKFGKENNNVVVESRLAWYFIPDSFKVKLICNLDERVRRVCERDIIDVKIAKDKTLKREADLMERFINYYNIEDYTNDSHFDLIIDTTNIDIEEVSKQIINSLKK